MARKRRQPFADVKPGGLFRGEGTRYHKEITKGVATATAFGGTLGYILPKKGQTRAYSAGQGAGAGASAYLLSYGARGGYKYYYTRKRNGKTQRVRKSK